MNYLRRNYSSRRTPQSEPLPGQAPNSAGGYAYAVDDWTRMQRFLILGSEGGTYYVGERALTRENAEATMRCIAQNGARAVREIVAVSRDGRAPKNDPAIFALALAASHGDEATRRAALDALSAVCRIGTHLFTFAGYVENFRGWGRGLRQAVGRWYERDDLAYQLVKYRQRGGWTHRDLLRLAHPKPRTAEHEALFRFAVGKPVDVPPPTIINAYLKAQAASTAGETAALVREYPDLPREALNPDHLTSIEVWDALLDQGMPMTALIRNLATMTRIGLLAPMNSGTRRVAAQIADSDRLRKSRVHPLAVLVALGTYLSGHSYRGGSTWVPVPEVCDALDSAFYAAFGNVEATGKRTLLALDVSGSMAVGDIANMPGISPRVGSVAMALVTAAVEPTHYIMGFSGGFVPLTVSPRQRLRDACRQIDGLRFDRTDCAIPMLWALKTRTEVDTFVVYTDSETWAGRIHPVQALAEYRRQTGIAAKLVVVGMVSNGFSIADPNDSEMLDVVGFDTTTPNVIAGFAMKADGKGGVMTSRDPMGAQ